MCRSPPLAWVSVSEGTSFFFIYSFETKPGMTSHVGSGSPTGCMSICMSSSEEHGRQRLLFFSGTLTILVSGAHQSCTMKYVPFLSAGVGHYSIVYAVIGTCQGHSVLGSNWHQQQQFQPAEKVNRTIRSVKHTQVL